jgi:dephospho-CoA kinase
MIKKGLIIGITGGLATGKTLVADMFGERGAVKIDADDISHRVMDEDPAVKRELVDIFGEEILSGDNIDRRKMAKKVFCNKEELDKLCSVLHPAIIRRIKEEIKENKDKVVVLDAPLLIETGLHEMMDIVIVVFASYENQIKRAADRGISEKEAECIIAMQMPLAEKVKIADFIIDNDSDDIEKTKEGVEEIWQKM